MLSLKGDIKVMDYHIKLGLLQHLVARFATLAHRVIGMGRGEEGEERVGK